MKATAKQPNNDTITEGQYRAFQQAYDFFNAALFGGTLPAVLVTLQAPRQDQRLFRAGAF
jgi:hypothetical protein